MLPAELTKDRKKMTQETRPFVSLYQLFNKIPKDQNVKKQSLKNLTLAQTDRDGVIPFTQGTQHSQLHRDRKWNKRFARGWGWWGDGFRVSIQEHETLDMNGGDGL